MAASNSTFVFNVRRSEPELVSPARPTPTELKPLSDIDDQEGLRYQQSVILFYPVAHDQFKDDKDPAKAIKAALAEAFVYYYPLAGRIRDNPLTRKLVVDCTAEGVVFVEAEADIRLEQLVEESLQPPFPCTDDLLYLQPRFQLL